MIKIALTIPLLLTVLFHAGAEAQKKRPSPRPKNLTAREIAERVMPSVVLIITQDENGNPVSQGSGFVYKPGLVVSNLHVFERATSAIVKNVRTGETSKALEVVAMNARQDICVIRIADSRFPVLSTGDSFAVKTGDDIYVASNPKGLEGSLTKGIISSVRERDRKDKGDDELLNWVKNISGETDRTLFQIDAAISSGSSGGALLNSRGQAIGIVRSSVVSGQNLNFAIPIDQLLTLEMKFKHPIVLAGACAYNDRLKWKLKGPVKLVKESYVDPDSGIEIKSIREFDVFGNNVRYIGRGGFRDTEVVREFDENGLITSLSFEDRIRKKLDSRKFSGTTLVNDDGVDDVSDFAAIGSTSIFDSFGNETVNIQQRAENRWVKTFEYNSDGRLIKLLESVSGRIYPSRFTYKLDRYGNWIERKQEIQYLRDGEWEHASRNVVREIEYYNQ